MSRSALGLRLLGALAAAAALQGATALARQTTAAKLRVIISEKGTFTPMPPHGTFVLSGPASKDSGASSISPGAPGPDRLRDGQRYNTVSATDILHGKKGDLAIALTGISVNATEKLFVEYGTWHIVDGGETGIYARWREAVAGWRPTTSGTTRFASKGS